MDLDLSKYFDEAMACDLGEPPSRYGIATNVASSYVNNPMKIGWLQSKQKWPECADLKIERYMADHDFYHYQETKDDSKRHLQAIMDELRPLFNSDEWKENESVHVENLKRKVVNKIHRVRDKRNPLAGIKKAFKRLSTDRHEDAFEFLAVELGLGRAQSILNDLHHTSINQGYQG